MRELEDFYIRNPDLRAYANLIERFITYRRERNPTLAIADILKYAACSLRIYLKMKAERCVNIP